MMQRPQPGVISALGVVMILAWGSSVYLIAAIAGPVTADTGWPLVAVTGAFSGALAVAGLASPAAGRLIVRHGGRAVLTGGCALLAAGLAVMAAAPSLPVFVLGWAVIGLGMAGALYDPAFATLGRLYGAGARGAITRLTLWGGFASTVCWPLSALLLENFGWRGTALGYAALHLLVTIPLIRLGIPAGPGPMSGSAGAQAAPERVAPDGAGLLRDGIERAAYVLIGVWLVIAGLVLVSLTTHLFTFLQAQGHTLAAAVALGALFGPAQVAGRLLEMAGRGRYHPVWTLAGSVGLAGAGVVLLAADLGLAGIALILFGMGNGLSSIARGSLPLALFGPDRLPLVLGRLARPALIAQAVAPVPGAWAIGALGAPATLVILAALSVLNLCVLAVLWGPVARLRQRPAR